MEHSYCFYWTEPSPAEELAEAVKRQIEESRPFSQTHYDDIDKFNKQGWDKDEEAHKRKVELFKKLEDKDLPPSEYTKIMQEINSL